MSEDLQNPNPVIFQATNVDKDVIHERRRQEQNTKIVDEIDNLESE